MKAGFAKIDITPPLGVNLGGYYRERYSDHVIEPLYATAVAFSDGERTAIAISVDILEILQKDTDVIRVTGYLVKLSEVEEYRKCKAVLDTTTNFGSGAKDGLKIMQRKVRGFDYA